jgi:hypothetical protein
MDMQPAGPARAHSFDVFDTLITRCWWRPEDLFLHAGAEVARLGLTQRRRRPGPPVAWPSRPRCAPCPAWRR